MFARYMSRRGQTKNMHFRFSMLRTKTLIFWPAQLFISFNVTELYIKNMFITRNTGFKHFTIHFFVELYKMPLQLLKTESCLGIITCCLVKVKTHMYLSFRSIEKREALFVNVDYPSYPS